MADARVQIILEGVDRTSNAFKGVNQRLNSMADNLRKLRGPALLVTGALSAIGAASIKSASSLTESINKAGLAFRDSIDIVTAFSKESAFAMGIAEQDALDYASVLGFILNASGMTRQASADMSIQMVKLAADIASVNDIPIADALRAIRSGLVGEVEPLRRFGILLSQAALKTKALEMGLISGKEEMSEAVKVQARFSSILEQTTDIQGDAVNTAESFANSMKRFQAQVKDAAGQIGMVLIPNLEGLMVRVNDAMKAFNDLTDASKKKIIAIVGIGAALGALILILPFVLSGIAGVITIFGGLLVMFKLVAIGIFALFSPITLIVVAVAAMAVAWINNWGGIRDFTKIILQEIQDFLFQWVENSILGFQKWIDVYNMIASRVEKLPTIDKTVGDIFKDLAGVAKIGFEKAEVAAKSFADSVVDKVGDIPGLLKNVLDETLGNLGELIGKDIPGIDEIIASIKEQIKAAVEGIFEMSTATGDMNDGLKEGMELTKNIADNMFDAAAAAKVFSTTFDKGIELQNRINRFLAAGGDPSMVAGLQKTVDLLLGGFMPPSHITPMQHGSRNFRGGMALVGEAGPELVQLPRGSNVFSNAESAGFGGGNVININAMSLGSDPLERRRIAEELAAEIGLLLAEEQRTR